MSCLEQFSYTKSGKIIEKKCFFHFLKKESNFRKYNYRVSK